VLVEESISFQGEGGECSLKARFVVVPVTLAPLRESGGKGMSMREGEKSSEAGVS